MKLRDKKQIMEDISHVINNKYKPGRHRASFNLTANNKNLQTSLTRLSSGKRITKPADDAGGLAVSMKLSSSISRTKAAISNIQKFIIVR